MKFSCEGLTMTRSLYGKILRLTEICICIFFDSNVSCPWRKVLVILFDGKNMPGMTVGGDAPLQQHTENIRCLSSHRSHSQISVKTTRAQLGFIPTRN